MHPLIVTIDGPSGTGKSTVSRLVADRLRIPHLDTGAFYRAVAVLAIRAGMSPTDEDAVLSAIDGAHFDQVDGRIAVDGEDLGDVIRQPEVGQTASAVAAHPRVRIAMVEEQRAWVARNGGSGVVEGRDIGSVVFPDAVVKVYLDADPAVRAERRALETGQAHHEVLGENASRDIRDSSRGSSPLLVPDGAHIVDSTDLEIDEVVARIVELAENASI